jgi:hypothetical protein
MTTLLTVARQLPRALREQYLHTVAALLRLHDVTDATVHRACHAAAARVLEEGRKRHRGR